MTWGISILLLLISVGLVCAEFVYPDVHRDSTVENLHGTQLPDPYRWLEDPNSNETKKFIADQNKLTFDFIRDNEHWGAVNKSFGELYDYARYSVPSKQGDRYYLSVNSGLQNQAIIYSQETLDGEREPFFDPNRLSADGTNSLHFTSFSPDGKWFAYGISEGGSDWITIKIMDVATKEDLPEVLTKIKFAYVGWNKNNKGFFYAYYDNYNGTGDGSDTGKPQYQRVYYHVLNTPQKQDINIFGFDDKPLWLIGTPIVSDDGKRVFIFPSPGTSNTPWYYADFDQDNIQPLEFKPIVEQPNAEYFYVGGDDSCTYIRTNYLAKNFRLVCVDLTNPAPENWVDIIPGAANEKHVLQDTLIVNYNYTVAVYMIDVVSVLRIFDKATGRFLFDVDTPIGTIGSISGKAKSNEFFYKITSFTSPGTIYRYDFSVKPNKIRIFAESKVAGISADEYVTDQVWYPSKDGTQVPMFLVHRKSLVKNGKNPTLLYAYGGFNIAIQPDYNALGIFFARNLNGIYAVANIRGGGEFGDDWHTAGMLLKKQNVFDDFAAAGRWLISNQYTSRDYLTTSGRSNGGLLMGATSNQFPDIFGASLAAVGVMDMIRYPLFTIGWAWVEEYGDPQGNKEHFEYILKYSPVHSIDSSLTQYPNMLVLTADHDDRVVPLHSYKFIAELQNKLGKTVGKNTPLMIRVDSNSGHGAGKPVFKWIEEYTDCVCFLMNTLKYEYTP